MLVRHPFAAKGARTWGNKCQGECQELGLGARMVAEDTHYLVTSAWPVPVCIPRSLTQISASASTSGLGRLKKCLRHRATRPCRGGSGQADLCTSRGAEPSECWRCT